MYYAVLLLTYLGKRASENDSSEGSSQSPGMQTEVINMSLHFLIVSYSRRIKSTFLIYKKPYMWLKNDVTCVLLFL